MQRRSSEPIKPTCGEGFADRSALQPVNRRRALTTVARMGSVSHPRGRLPARVYWTRRAMVLVVALLSSSASASCSAGPARTSPAHRRSRPAATAPRTAAPPPSPGTSLRPGGAVQGHAKAKARCPLAAARRGVPGRRGQRAAVGAAPLRRPADPDRASSSQGIQPACTFKVSPESLVVKIASGTDRIWSSQDCPARDPERRGRGPQRPSRSPYPSSGAAAAPTTTAPGSWPGRCRASTTCTPRPSARRRPTCSSR